MNHISICHWSLLLELTLLLFHRYVYVLFTGYIFDITHSYDIGFFMTGGLVLFAMIGFCMLELPAIKRRENQDAI